MRNNPLVLIDPVGLRYRWAGDCLYEDIDYFVDNQYLGTDSYTIYCGPRIHDNGPGDVWADPVEDRMEPHSEIQDVAKGCYLHCNRAMCLVALALSVYLLISAILKVAGPVSFPVHRTPLFLLGPVMGVWLLATLARRCNRIQERLFYVVWIGYFVIVGVRAALPLSESAVRASDFLQVALGVAGIALSGAIALWHFRRGMHQADSVS